MTTNQRKLDAYRAGSQKSAEIILADPVAHGGEEPLMVRWAWLVMAASESTRRAE